MLSCLTRGLCGLLGVHQVLEVHSVFTETGEALLRALLAHLLLAVASRCSFPLADVLCELFSSPSQQQEPVVLLGPQLFSAHCPVPLSPWFHTPADRLLNCKIIHESPLSPNSCPGSVSLHIDGFCGAKGRGNH